MWSRLFRAWPRRRGSPQRRLQSRPNARGPSGLSPLIDSRHPRQAPYAVGAFGCEGWRHVATRPAWIRRLSARGTHSASIPVPCAHDGGLRIVARRYEGHWHCPVGRLGGSQCRSSDRLSALPPKRQCSIRRRWPQARGRLRYRWVRRSARCDGNAKLQLPNDTLVRPVITLNHPLRRAWTIAAVLVLSFLTVLPLAVGEAPDPVLALVVAAVLAIVFGPLLRAAVVASGSTLKVRRWRTHYVPAGQISRVVVDGEGHDPRLILNDGQEVPLWPLTSPLDGLGIRNRYSTDACRRLELWRTSGAAEGRS
jgi:hypothetical protein